MIKVKVNEFLHLFGLLLVCYSAANLVAGYPQATINKTQAEEMQLIEAEAVSPAPRFDHSVAMEPGSGPMPLPASVNGMSQPGETALEPMLQPEEKDRLPQFVKQSEPLSPIPDLVVPEIPSRLVIPAIALDAPVVHAETQFVEVGGKIYQQWLAPDQFAVGWHASSARLGELGNTVLNGHHNIHGEVFAQLVDVKEGDIILVYSDKKAYRYVIANKLILAEKYQQLDVRMDNARWILLTQDERLTLVTCWPKETNTHRLVIVAKPFAYDPRESHPGREFQRTE